MRSKAPETKGIPFNDNSLVVLFNDSFACLGTIIIFLLGNTVGTIIRMPKERDSAGALRFS